MPCAHQLLPRLVANEVLTKEDFHPFWWLNRSLQDEFPILRIQDPDIVKVLKGRPKDDGPFAGPVTKLEVPSSTTPTVLQLDATPPVPASRANPRPTKSSIRRTRSQ
ncbi:hypothetical protein B0T21DRAFT_294577 [Apiosordaria backusii]|uniref:Uncharacterized protein n=1 Tax=Apiosordaria backusii TaxID=314023 RepID=A0AA40ASI8_9PEZI|nr:hypothetical protein B0T21DRAFT_294577 [Apiosordaria backusii]